MRWGRSLFPREQLKVIHTDDLADPRNSQRVMDATFDFLRLPRIKIGNDTRVCVQGKNGVMDVLSETENTFLIGKKRGLPKLNVGACETSREGMHIDERTGAQHHDVPPELLRRMRAFYKPHNERLYTFLGKDLHW